MAAQVASWIDLVELCRELDDVLVEAGSPSPENLALHEAVVNLAIGCGGWLIHQLRTNGVEFSASGQTFETLEASLEMLRAFYRTWHPDFSPEEIEAVRQSVFHGAA